MNELNTYSSEEVDNLYLKMKKSENQLFRLSTFIYLIVLIFFISTFWFAIQRLDNQVQTQIAENRLLVDKLAAIEQELDALRTSLYEGSEVSPDEVKGQQVAQTIAKEANLRPASELERNRAQALAKETQRRDQNSNLVLLVDATNHVRQKEYEQALALVEEALTYQQNLSVAYSLKASILNSNGQKLKAIENQTLAIDIEAQKSFSSVLPNFYNTRGFWYLELGDLELAKQDFILGSDVAIGDEKSFIKENVVMVELFQKNWQAAFDLSTELLSLEVQGGWLSFFRAIAADKLNNKEAKKESLAQWQSTDNSGNSQRLAESIKGTAIDSYKKWIK